MDEVVDLLDMKCQAAVPGENQEEERKLYLREALRSYGAAREAEARAAERERCVEKTKTLRLFLPEEHRRWADALIEAMQDTPLATPSEKPK